MALHSISCSWVACVQPRQRGEEGTRSGGERRGGSATRAGEPEAGHPRSSAELSTATATGGSPQSPRDHHGSAAALALALPRFLPGLACSSPGCSKLQLGPSTQVPLRNSGQMPVAGAPGLEAREAFAASHLCIVTSSSGVRARCACLQSKLTHALRWFA
jgi:hypothetical protein